MTVDRQGVLTALNLATPVLEGHVAALERALKAMPDQADSPLARLGTVHFGRWSMFPGWPEPGQSALWFSADFEGSVQGFVAGVRKHLPDEAEKIWSHCVDWPGVQDATALERWMLNHRIPTHYFLAAAPDATLAQCRLAHDRRHRFVKLAIDAQKMNSDDILAAFRERFADLEK